MNIFNFKFERGDHIRVTTKDGQTFTGAALTTLSEIGGSAIFQIMLPGSEILTFNCNFDKYEVLFSAVIARGSREFPNG
jgi:hypothetical protein